MQCNCSAGTGHRLFQPARHPSYLTNNIVDAIGPLLLTITRGNNPPVSEAFGTLAPALTLPAFLFNLLFPPHWEAPRGLPNFLREGFTAEHVVRFFARYRGVSFCLFCSMGRNRLTHSFEIAQSKPDANNGLPCRTAKRATDGRCGTVGLVTHPGKPTVFEKQVSNICI